MRHNTTIGRDIKENEENPEKGIKYERKVKEAMRPRFLLGETTTM